MERPHEPHREVPDAPKHIMGAVPFEKAPPRGSCHWVYAQHGSQAHVSVHGRVGLRERRGYIIGTCHQMSSKYICRGAGATCNSARERQTTGRTLALSFLVYNSSTAPPRDPEGELRREPSTTGGRSSEAVADGPRPPILLRLVLHLLAGRSGQPANLKEAQTPGPRHNTRASVQDAGRHGKGWGCWRQVCQRRIAFNAPSAPPR